MKLRKRAAGPSVIIAVSALVAATSCFSAGASSTNQTDTASYGPIGNYFNRWFDRVSETQAEQPHWVTPVATVTPRLEEEYRYDQYWQTVSGGHTLNNYGGGKGLELIPSEHVELILGIPAWETENTSPRKSGWADETFLAKYRLLSANERNGNYILSAFMGLSIPTGSEDFTSHHYAFTPTIAMGKGWGRFDVQSTVGISFPDNGTAPKGAGMPFAFNTALQYRVGRFFWPEVEANYTYWPNGEHKDKSQLLLTPGLVLGRFSIWKRLGVTVAAGYQVSVTDKSLVQNNFILSGRIPF